MTQPEIKKQGWYARELVSEQCQCGQAKQAGKTFCVACWITIPRDIQHALYARIGSGYEAAYEEAIECLTGA